MIGKRFRQILFLAAIPLAAQTPFSLIQGTVHDGMDGRPVAGARVSYAREGDEAAGFACTDAKGHFALPGLSPATYRIEVRYFGAACASGEAPADTRKWRETDLIVSVAGRADLRIALWPMSDVWSERVFEGIQLPGARSLAKAYGPDLDTSRSENFNPIPANEALLDSAISAVTGARLVRDLPLAGRDIYTTLVLQPGVTSDAGAARGLGYSVTGQRGTSANFLVDGVEMNNPLSSGPLLSIAPEAVQEYRYSTSGFAAEYGRAAGVVANAVTRSGGNAWHGLAYLYGKHDALSANEWQRNATGQDRAPLRELQPGVSTGGPLVKDALFASLSAEALRFRSTGGYTPYLLPGANAVGPYLAGSGLQPFPSSGPLVPVSVRLEPRVSLDRLLLLPRLDLISKDEKRRTFVRFAYSRLDRPDLVWTPYEADKVPFRERSANLAVSHVAALTPAVHAELRAAVSGHSYSVVRPRPEIPFFLAEDDVPFLPGSPIAYDFAQRERTLQTTGAISWIRGAHLFKAGFDNMQRFADQRLATYPGGSRTVPTFDDFSRSSEPKTARPVRCRDVTRLACAGPPPPPRRDYTIAEPAWYAQGTLRLSERLVAHGGLRAETMGSPRAAAPDLELGYYYDRAPASAADIRAVRVAAADRLFPSLRAFSARAGLAYSWDGARRTTLRLGYGAFQDRLIEGIWFGARRGETALDDGGARAITAFDPRFRPGVAHDSFVAVQTALSDTWSAELTGQIASGRSLPSANLVNRSGTERRRECPIDCSRTDAFPYRGNQGESFYAAFTAALRARASRYQFQAAYTWSHSLDYQSDALQGYYGSIFSNPNGPRELEGARATFMRQFTRDGEWGSSDFDQRHNLVVHGTWEFRRGWNVAGLIAARTGFPFTVLGIGPPGGEPLRKARAAVKSANYATRSPEDGGWRILDPRQFAIAGGGLAATGRNAFAGPGLFAADVSLGRRWRRFTVRADAFNLLNHSNLGRPSAAVGTDDFGIAKVGRREEETGFPAVLPLVESPRRVQVLLRFEF